MVVRGRLDDPVPAKDLALHIVGSIGADGALYKSVEFVGEAIDVMSLASRMVLCNMAAEMGAKNGYCAPDDKTYAYLETRAETTYVPVFADQDATYEHVLEFDAALDSHVAAKCHLE